MAQTTVLWNSLRSLPIRIWASAILVSAALVPAAPSKAATIDFEGINLGFPLLAVSSHYVSQGVLFNADGLNRFELADNNFYNAPWTIPSGTVFATLRNSTGTQQSMRFVKPGDPTKVATVESLSFKTVGTGGSFVDYTAEAFDRDGNSLELKSITSAPNIQTIQFSASGIHRVEFTRLAEIGFTPFDDLTFDGLRVPEPATAVALLLGLTAVRPCRITRKKPQVVVQAFPCNSQAVVYIRQGPAVLAFRRSRC